MVSRCWSVVGACIDGVFGLDRVGRSAIVKDDVGPCLLFNGGSNVVRGGKVVAEEGDLVFVRE